MARSKNSKSSNHRVDFGGADAAKVRLPHRGPRRRLDIDERDHARLESVAARFGLPKSELVRRMIRAAHELGPALSKDNAAVVGDLAREVRAIGRSLSQLLHSIRRGEGAAPAAAEEVISRLVDSYAAINGELTGLTLAYGSRVRESVSMSDPAS